MKTKKLKINSIKPYWRNARENTEAVEKVVESIERYGYNQPILVDKKNVIIAGHTRYKALKELAFQEVEVIELNLTEEQAKAYRVIDNKTSEYAEWKMDDLLVELREINDITMMDIFFDDSMKEKMFETAGTNVIDVVDGDFESTENKVFGFADFNAEYEQSIKTINCPHCKEEFEVR